MANSIEDKESLTERLEEDRRKMAIRAGALKKDYNVINKIKSAVGKNPWLAIIAAVLGGFLLSRLPARRKKVYLWYNYLQQENPARLTPVVPRDRETSPIHKVWLFVKPLVGAFFVKNFYRYFKRLKNADRSDKTNSSSRCEQSD
jgi:hypothetical protein